MGIDANQLVPDIEQLALSGIVLSIENRASLQTSLSIAREQYKFDRIYFWGKILGTKEDYFIAVGTGSNEIKQRTFLYSHDCIKWKLLNPPTEEHFERLSKCTGRFTGDPSHEFECKTIKLVGNGDEEVIEEDITKEVAVKPLSLLVINEPDPNNKRRTDQIRRVQFYSNLLKEEDRLAAVINEIEREAVIVPRGSFILQPTGEIVKNRLFEGLNETEAAKFCNYFHFKVPELLETKSPLYKANLDKAVDFLDPIDEDMPKGCWSLQFERGSALVLLRSLKWPGASFFHVPSTNSYGSLYFGIGERNKDIPFML